MVLKSIYQFEVSKLTAGTELKKAEISKNTVKIGQESSLKLFQSSQVYLLKGVSYSNIHSYLVKSLSRVTSASR